MSGLEIIRVETSRDKKQFFNWLWEHYKDDPNWIPPLRANQKELLGFKKHPFHERAKVQAFLARRDGKVCGRVAGIINEVHIEQYNEERGFFGFFETINDQEVVNGLMDAVRGWLSEHGIEELRGPVNPSLNYECGLLIEGFDSPPTFMMTYNHPFYGELLEGYGFRKVEDLVSFWGHSDMIETLDKKLFFISKEAKERFKIDLRPISKKNFSEDVMSWLKIYNSSLIATWGFTPLSDAEMKHMAGAMRHLIVPELTTIDEIEGRPDGAVFALPDYNPRIKKINGRLFHFGFIHLLSNRRAIKKVSMISTNVIPEYQRWGVGLVILERLVPAILDFGIQDVEFSWVLESNHLSFKTLKKGGAVIDKRFRIYDLDLSEAGSIGSP